jgi:hypothetical protein
MTAEEKATLVKQLLKQVEEVNPNGFRKALPA